MANSIKKILLLMLLLIISTKNYSINIRIRIEDSNIIRMYFKQINVKSKGLEKTLYQMAIISSSKKGITLFYNNKTYILPYLTFYSKKIKINGRYYKGVFKIIKLGKKIDVILTIPLENYVLGVLPGEMPSNWPLNALKAQAILARTYGYYHILQHKKYYDLTNDINFQIFTTDLIKNKNVQLAVKSTRNLVLMYANYPIVVFYHSTCGGVTESAENVWGKGYPYLISKKCPYCSDSPYYTWSYQITMDSLVNILNKHGADFDYITDVKYDEIDSSGRIIHFVFLNTDTAQKFIVKGNDLRMWLGPDKLKSLLLTAIDIDGYHITFKGKGFGHGVGLCQYGAKTMAEEGFSYAKILDFFFPGTNLSSIPQ